MATHPRIGSRRGLSCVTLSVLLVASACAAQPVEPPAASPPSPPASPTTGQPTEPAVSPPVSGPAGPAVPVDPTDPGVAELVGYSAEELRTRVTADDVTPTQRFGAIHEVLARGGVAVGDFETNYVGAYPPASGLVLLPQEVATIAVEASAGQSAWTMDAVELAGALEALGWPFDGGRPPAEQLVLFVRQWWQGAAESADDVHSFAPAFIRSMVEWRRPEVDFDAETPAPEDVRIGLLELVLFGAAFERILAEDAASGGALPAGAIAARQARPTPHVPFRFQPVTPCSAYQGLLFGRLGESEAARFLSGLAAGKGLDAALDALGLSEAAANRVGRVLFGVGMFMRVVRAILLTRYVGIAVTHEAAGELHKPDEGELLNVAFRARAGIPPEEWDEYQNGAGAALSEAIRDCLSWLGLSIPSLSQIVSEMETWAVEWTLSDPASGGGLRPQNPNADWSESDQISPPSGRRHLGRWRTGVHRSGDASVGISNFVIRILEEKESDHPGLLLQAPVDVCAQLDLARDPTLSTFAGAAFGPAGLAESIVDLLTGMMQKLSKPEHCRQLSVTFHKRYEIQIEYRRESSFAASVLSTTGVWVGSGPVALESTAGSQFTGSGGLGIQGDINVTVKSPRRISCSATVAEGFAVKVDGTVDWDRKALYATASFEPDRDEVITLRNDCPPPYAGMSWTNSDLPGTSIDIEIPLEDGASDVVEYKHQLGGTTLTFTLVEK